MDKNLLVEEFDGETIVDKDEINLIITQLNHALNSLEEERYDVTRLFIDMARSLVVKLYYEAVGSYDEHEEYAMPIMLRESENRIVN